MIEQLDEAQRRNATACVNELIREILSQFTGEFRVHDDRSRYVPSNYPKATQLLQEILEEVS